MLNQFIIKQIYFFARFPTDFKQIFSVINIIPKITKNYADILEIEFRQVHVQSVIEISCLLADFKSRI